MDIFRTSLFSAAAVLATAPCVQAADMSARVSTTQDIVEMLKDCKIPYSVEDGAIVISLPGWPMTIIDATKDGKDVPFPSGGRIDLVRIMSCIDNNVPPSQYKRYKERCNNLNKNGEFKHYVTLQGSKVFFIVSRHEFITLETRLADFAAALAYHLDYVGKLGTAYANDQKPDSHR